MIDLNDFDLSESAEKGAEMELEHPVSGEVIRDDDGNPVVFSVMGMDSSAYRNKQREIQNRRMAKMMKGKNNNPMLSDADACELLAACTKGWSDNLELNGEVLKFSEKAALKLYMDYHWIREQVDSFIGDRENFYKG